MFFGIPSDQGIVYGIILYGTGAIIIAMFVREIASWVRIDERYAFIRFLARMTDSFIFPIRRFNRRIAIIEIEISTVFFLFFAIERCFFQSVPFGWLTS